MASSPCQSHAVSLGHRQPHTWQPPHAHQHRQGAVGYAPSAESSTRDQVMRSMSNTEIINGQQHAVVLPRTFVRSGTIQNVQWFAAHLAKEKAK